MSRRDLIRILKGELGFFLKRGYGYLFRSLWRPTLLFRDSPTCLNFRSSDPLRPCCNCKLIEFVPAEKRDVFMPCHHIPLNQNGDTIARLYQKDTQRDLDRAFHAWLCNTISKLEKEEASHENA